MIDEKIIEMLCISSDRALDDRIKPRLRALVGRDDIKDELMGIIDDCVFAGLTSDLVISILHRLWQDEGGTIEELKKRNDLLREGELSEEMKKKFKWQMCPYRYQIQWQEEKDEEN